MGGGKKDEKKDEKTRSKSDGKKGLGMTETNDKKR